MKEVTFENVSVGARLLVKPDKSNATEERTVIKKIGPNHNNIYCLTMDNGDEYYGLGYKELKQTN